MEILLVGGAVRDKLLGLEIKDKDWVVVGGTPEYFLKKGYEQVGADFPVFLHPETKDEYALARKERKVGKGYGGFVTSFEPTVTIEEDLYRRDLTINAIAQKENGELIDPYNGIKDLKNKVIRHVSKHFEEDPLRVLRVARFMARYGHLGFKVHPETMDLMKKMVLSGELKELVAERVFKELDEKVFNEPNPSAFFYTLKECGALKEVFPEIDNLFGVPQPEKHHPEVDTGIHTLMVLDQAKKITNNKAVMYAALVHDLGKAITPKEVLPSHIKHEINGIPIIKSLSERLKVPSHYKKLALNVCEHHTTMHRALELGNKKIYDLFKNLDAFRNPKMLDEFILACEADARGRKGLENRDYSQPEYLKYLFNSIKDINAKKFVEAGFFGREVGEKVETERVEKIAFYKKLYKPNVLKKAEEFKHFIINFDKMDNVQIIRNFKNLGVDKNIELLEAMCNALEINNPRMLKIAKEISNINPQKFLDRGVKGFEVGLSIEQEKLEIIEKHSLKNNKNNKLKI